MILSHNVLKINSIDVALEEYFQGKRFKASLHATITFCCSVSGQLMKKIFLTSYYYSTGVDDAQRGAIQEFLDGRNVETYTQYFRPTGNLGSTMHGKINHIDYADMPEPYYSMFRDLFNSDKWNADNFMLAAETKKLAQSNR